MNIHEYQAKAVLREFGVPVPRGVPAFSVEEAVKGAQDLGGPVWVVKAQIHAGGRGKAGGVKVVKSIDDVKKESARILGSTLVTHQTGPHGKKVNRLYIEEGSAIDREFYLSALIDRETSRVAFVVSTEGGMDIEEVAHKTPEKILTFSVDPATGIMPHHGRRVAQTLKLTGDLAKQIEGILPKLYSAFTTKDMSLLEINPLVVTKDNKIICLDAKVGFDGNALYRHPDIVELRDLTEEDEKEVEASRYDLNYIALDGSIGCMVNGAGLAMATMDIIKLYGGAPANFLDVGGGATSERVTAAFELILSNSRVRAVLVNIFGSWCPNCNDEAPLLAAWDRKYRQRGLEIVGLAYEFTGDAARDREMVRRFAKHYGITYPLLLAGVSDKKKASATLPDLTRVLAYPTSLFIGRDGKVKKIYSGFAGPGTGRHFGQLRAEMESVIETMLAEEKR